MAEMEPKKSNIVGLPFAYYRATGTVAPANMTAFAAGTSPRSTRLAVPFSGSIVGLSAVSRNAVGTGSCTLRVFDAGTATTPVIKTALTTSASASNTTLRRGVYSVSANDLLGVSFTSHTFDSGSASNIIATIWVHMEQN